MPLARVDLNATTESILIGLLVGLIIYVVGVYIFKAPQQIVGLAAFIVFLLVAFL